MRLNEKGQCPKCLVKPLTYKRTKKYYCTRCDRSFIYPSGEWEVSFFWIEPNTRRPHNKGCLCGDCPQDKSKG